MLFTLRQTKTRIYRCKDGRAMNRTLSSTAGDIIAGLEEWQTRPPRRECQLIITFLCYRTHNCCLLNPIRVSITLLRIRTTLGMIARAAVCTSLSNRIAPLRNSRYSLAAGAVVLRFQNARRITTASCDCLLLLLQVRARLELRVSSIVVAR